VTVLKGSDKNSKFRIRYSEVRIM